VAAASLLPEIVALPSYIRDARALFSDEDQRAVEWALAANPEAGAVIAGTGGVRKLRVALTGRGKSGGARVIYFHRSAKGRIYLLAVYAKNVRQNLSKAERNAMRLLTAVLQREP
jgi:hypothetical protein